MYPKTELLFSISIEKSIKHSFMKTIKLIIVLIKKIIILIFFTFFAFKQLKNQTQEICLYPK